MLAGPVQYFEIPFLNPRHLLALFLVTLESQSVLFPYSTLEMHITTVILTLTLKPDATIDDTSSVAHEILQAMLKEVSEAKGYVRQYWVSSSLKGQHCLRRYRECK